MSRFPRTAAALAALVLLVALAACWPAAGPILLVVTIGGVGAAMRHEHARC